MEHIRSLLEHNAFGVCSYIADKMGISLSSVRMNFIYLSVLTFGSPIIIYLVLAFFLNIGKAIKNRTALLID